MLDIRPAGPEDWPAILGIVGPVLAAGETYSMPRDLTEEQVRAYWLGADKQTFVAIENGVVLGTYYIRPNQQGGGAHVCNCGYMTGAAAQGKGIARAMCAHSLDHARALGYRAMQFNFVVSSNERAVKLWQSLGFSIVGTLPGAFAHPRLGFVDALVMFKTL